MVKGHSRATIGLYRVLIGLLLLTPTDFLLAGPAPDIVKQKKKVAKPPVEEEVAVAGQNPIGESEQARATKNYGIGARLGGAH